MLHAMIMAGGGGTRFWPRSRQRRPKQFLTLAGDRTLLQQTFDRIEALVPAEHTWVITGHAYRDETAGELPALPAEQIVGEPCGRDTAPCVGLGAALVARHDPDAVLVVMPADHVIEPAQEFRRAVHGAVQLVSEHPDALVTIGIPPTFPATGYGYIRRGPALPGRQGLGAFRVGRFAEKPKLPQAEEFFASGEYFWNSGLFIWRAATLLEQLRVQQPEMRAAIDRIAAAWDTPQRQAVLEREYPGLRKVSVDIAVLEHAPEVLVVQAPFRWDDVGSWLALERMHPQDADGNTVLAREHIHLDTHNCVVVAPDGHLVATVGISDLLIIQDGDVTLVAGRKHEGDIRKLVEQLRERGLERHL
jgi:mannose-1-phosphate guanylyltransferase